MSRLILAGALVLAFSSSASAQAVKLRGAAADSFVAKYFPNAAVPGRVKGQFTYANKSGERHAGLAKCDIPAMGARTEGAVSHCKVLYRPRIARRKRNGATTLSVIAPSAGSDAVSGAQDRTIVSEYERPQPGCLTMRM